MRLLTPSYLNLPPKFYQETRPQISPEPKLVVYNDILATKLGITVCDPQVLSGSTILPQTIPIALGYGGHQFGQYTILGDGRAVLLGEHLSPDGSRWDIQLKGSGQTPYSRRGDGKATLGPMLREYIISEYMASLGIPTTRCLAVLTTGESVNRNGPEPGAIVVRVASSHLRVGTFEFATEEEIQVLADFTIERHYPYLKGQKDKYVKFLDEVIKRQASLVADWMSVGFIHGVINTDNVALSGETIDYGPCAFMNQYNPATVYSSIDTYGRYAYGNQPKIMQWNLARFAETLLPLLSESKQTSLSIAKEMINAFALHFNNSLEEKMKKKLGGSTIHLAKLYEWMYEHKADYTNTFASLNSYEPSIKEDKFIDWYNQWQSQAEFDPVNPKVIPRNQKVEETLASAVINNDLNPFLELLEVVRQPFNVPPLQYTISKEPLGYCTFCGT